jgi:1,4-alpha-glucan branching enzyme
MTTLNDSFEAIAQGRHRDPFKVLGPHAAQKNWVVRSWQPQAHQVELLDAEGRVLAALEKVHADGLYQARLPLTIPTVFPRRWAISTVT